MVPNMKEVLELLDSQGHTMVLVSGSNRFCVHRFLDNHGITKYFDSVHCLGMDYNHNELIFTYENTITDCKKPICTHGFCKGEALKKYLDESPHEHILYFGDGANDLCGISQI